MAIYNISGQKLDLAYDLNGTNLNNAYDGYGNLIYTKGASDYETDQIYKGGYIEIQPDSWDGSTPVTGDIVQPSDPTAWGFPWSLSSAGFNAIQNEILNGEGKGIMYIRFPLGFAYRGYRNIDTETGLAKNIGERWTGQNASLKSFFSKIASAGGGLSPEYWCLAPYWTTGGAYYNANVLNEVWAGGSYPRTTSLESIRTSDRAQYNAQIEALSDAILNDLEYIHVNVCPVRLFGLANEPWQNGQKYGTCKISKSIYVALMEKLVTKIGASSILQTYNNVPNTVLFYDNDGYCGNASYLWGHAIPHTNTRAISGEKGGSGAVWYKTATLKQNSFLNEYEYWSSARTDEFRCANDMLHMVNGLVYGRAEVIHPIIHICKPTGQTSSDTNTRGYCVYAVDMSDGSYTYNTWAYNAWKMINDNLPIGAERVTEFTADGFMCWVYNGKLLLFMANNTENSKTITVDFGNPKTFSGKLYNLTNLGTAQQSVSGSSIEFMIPAYSGLVYLEDITS